jgi:hypothetical protein
MHYQTIKHFRTDIHAVCNEVQVNQTDYIQVTNELHISALLFRREGKSIISSVDEINTSNPVLENVVPLYHVIAYIFRKSRNSIKPSDTYTYHLI